jgi:exosortase/archaeosortase family protein
VNTPLPGIAATPSRFGLVPRLVTIAAVASAEALLDSYLVQAIALDALHGAPEALRLVQHWLFRFIIAYAVSLALLACLRGGGVAVAVVVAATLAHFATFAPAAVCIGVLRKTGGLPVFAVLPAAAAVAAIKFRQMLWVPAAEITCRFVNLMLKPVLPGLQSDPAARVLGTGRFAVQIAEVRSGLEGVGLMLAFCAAWLWSFRREYRFPRALVVIPIGVIAVFLLNALRIAALILIGNAGYERVAVVGFHSQAAWIAFNLAAFGIAILAHTNPWLSRVAAERRARRVQIAEASGGNGAVHLEARPRTVDSNPTAAYALDVGFSWRGPVTGALVFGVWMASARLAGHVRRRARRPHGALARSARSVDRLPPDLGRGHGASCRRAGVPRLSAAPAHHGAFRVRALLGGSLARARRERPRVRRRSRPVLDRRHRRGARLRRCRDAHQQTGRIRRRARHHQCVDRGAGTRIQALVAVVSGRKGVT